MASGRGSSSAHPLTISTGSTTVPSRSAPTREDPLFGLHVPTFCPGMPAVMLIPRDTWSNPQASDLTARRLAGQFRDNFEQYAGQASLEVREAGPRTS